jgi:hypothetical protein
MYSADRQSVQGDTCRYLFIQCTPNNKMILAGLSRNIKRRHFFGPIRDTDSRSLFAVPQINLRDIKHMSYVQSSDSQFGIKPIYHTKKIKRM